MLNFHHEKTDNKLMSPNAGKYSPRKWIGFVVYTLLVKFARCLSVYLSVYKFHHQGFTTHISSFFPKHFCRQFTKHSLNFRELFSCKTSLSKIKNYLYVQRHPQYIRRLFLSRWQCRWLKYKKSYATVRAILMTRQSHWHTQVLND